MPLTIEDASRIALSFPEAEAHEHWGRPSFRVKGKIFVTFWPDERRAVIKLAPDVQRELVEEEAEVYSMVNGAWGAHGYTNVHLAKIEESEFTAILEAAWRKVAPKRALAAYEGNV